MKAVKLLVALVLAGSLFAIPLASQVTPLRVEDVVAMRSFSEFTPVRFSPDGQRLVYAVKHKRIGGIYPPNRYPLTGVPVNGIGADLVVTELGTGSVIDVTNQIGNNWAPAWSPDSRHLAFISDRDGSGQAKLWIWQVATGEVRKVSDVIVRSWELQWLPNNRDILLTALPENLSPAQFAERLSGNTAREGPSSVTRGAEGSTVVVYRSTSDGARDSSKAHGPWNLEFYLRDLILVDVNTGEARRIDRAHRITAYALAPDGSNVAVTIAKRFEKPASQQILFDLKVFATRTGQQQTLATDIRLRFDGATFSWAPDGSRLVYQTGGPEGTGDCYLAGLKGGPPRNITNLQSRPGRGAPPPLWDTEGRTVYFIHEDSIWKASADLAKAAPLTKIPQNRLIEVVARQGTLFSPDGGRSLVALTYNSELKQSAFYAVDIKTGETTKLLQGNQWYAAAAQAQNVSVSPDGKLTAFFRQDAQRPRELWVAGPDLRNVRRLTYMNPQLEKYQMGAARLIEWRGLDGELLNGVLLLPAEYAEGKSYPLIVCVYGGAFLSDYLVRFGLGSCGAMNMQLFATRGYAVLLPDAPQRLGTPMADLAKTVLPGVDKVVEMGIADPKRLGVMGHSYGGYSVFSLIVQTKRFKAAMAANGSGDLMASYGQMNKDGSAFGQSVAETGQALMGGTPWQFRERYIENSPVFYLDRVETPLLIVHGAEDPTVASFLSDEVFVALRRLGKTVEYAKYEGEGHSPLDWSYPNQLDFCNRVIEWFDAHIRGQPANH